jgi:feruloyl esterase
MVRHVIADHDLDGSRVFVTGLSAGGAMSVAMLATYPEMFAGGAVIAGLPYGSAGSMTEAFAAMNNSRTTTASAAGDAVRVASGGTGPWPPISIWHGQSDAVVKPGAGEALAAQWVNVHGIDAAPVTARTPSGRDFLVWMTAEGDPVVELHRIVGMGHGTPLNAGGEDGSGTAGPYLLDVGISSSLEIALGWGIAEPTPDPASAKSAKARKPQSSPPDRTARRSEARPAPKLAIQPAADPAAGVRAIIEQALRTAGLMK